MVGATHARAGRKRKFVSPDKLLPGPPRPGTFRALIVPNKCWGYARSSDWRNASAGLPNGTRHETSLRRGHLYILRPAISVT